MKNVAASLEKRGRGRKGDKLRVRERERESESYRLAETQGESQTPQDSNRKTDRVREKFHVKNTPHSNRHWPA